MAYTQRAYFCGMLLLLYFWVAAATGLVIYYLGVLLPFVFGNMRQEIVTRELPKVSVLICARNELENLKQNLALILDQVYPQGFEVLVINDASSDGTREWLKAQTGRYTQLRVLHLTEGEKRGKGKKGALELGIEQATYPNYILTDADCRPASERWLFHMASALAGKNLVLGYGPISHRKGSFLNAFCRWEAWQTAVSYFSLAYRGFPYMGVGRNLGYTDALYSETGGFSAHIDLASGDDDLFVAAGRKKAKVALQLSPESFMYSRAPLGWLLWFKQRTRHLSTAYRYPFRPKVLLALLGLFNLFFYLLLPFALWAAKDFTLAVFFGKVLFQYLICFPLYVRFKALTLWPFTFVFECISTVLTAFFHVRTLFKGQHTSWK